MSSGTGGGASRGAPAPKGRVVQQRRPALRAPAHPGSTTGTRPATAAATPAGSGARRFVRRLADGLVIGLLVGVTAGLVASLPLAGDPDGAPGAGGAAGGAAVTEPASAAGAAGLDERVAELEAEAAERDAAAVDDLTVAAAELLDLLAPVIEETASATEQEQAPTAEQVGRWQAAVVSARAVLGDPPSAGTGVNVARAGFVASVDQIDVLVQALALATGPGDPAGDPAADPAGALEVAAGARRAAASTWSVAATQLDAVAVGAGIGHVHLYLPPVAGSGALTADPEPAQAPGAPEG